MSEPYRVMTVCTGNICRSPMAEVVLREAFAAEGLDGRVSVDSSGVSAEEEGNPVDRRAQRVLAAHGYPVGDDHRAHRVTSDEVACRDLLLPMTAHHARALRRLVPDDGAARCEIRLFRSFDPEAPELRAGVGEDVLDVDDPWYGGAEAFEVTLRELEAATPGIVAYVKERLGS
ncbi:low molecular weight phosphotyrosine protein phosphatase [Xylanimonas allomyrinae]|uniref:protein-tyrosine-phosphatase n=1 Tax=Xylanimonas allomyrinae TaxID=2509459 RepID=A0A4P6ER98_9MICO|nr:low molecular weight protein-tyrosine-phosphatase [Xylanimonas allomyrinae]QAY64019.1 low molecular weight phosphotyrosine protein phosphatase [Xylanimonas allomyrinae]